MQKVLFLAHGHPGETAAGGVMAVVRAEQKDGFVSAGDQAVGQPEKRIHVALATEGNKEDAH